jgi:hypothetical protein
MVGDLNPDNDRDLHLALAVSGLADSALQIGNRYNEEAPDLYQAAHCCLLCVPIALSDPDTGGVMRLVSRSGLIATTLAIAAIAVSTAQASGLLSGTTPDPPGAAQHEAQSFLRIYSHSASTPSVVAAPNQAAPASASLELNPPAAGTTTNPRTPASTNLCSEVCFGGGYTARDTGAALPHDPRARSVVLAGAGYGYGSTPIASSGSDSPRSEVVSGAGYGNPNAPATVVRVVVPSDGFDWGDAGIGAGGALALMTLLIGGALGATNIRRRATRSTA